MLLMGLSWVRNGRDVASNVVAQGYFVNLPAKVVLDGYLLGALAEMRVLWYLSYW